jgi:hypothetical protein
MNILQIKKGSKTNTLEKCHIYLETNNKQTKIYTVKNVMFLYGTTI